MKKISTLLIVLLFLFKVGQAQIGGINICPNPSFEAHTNTNPICSLETQNGFDAYLWESLSSSDYYGIAPQNGCTTIAIPGSFCPTPNYFSFKPSNGSYCTGSGSCEGMQIQLMDKFEPFNWDDITQNKLAQISVDYLPRCPSVVNDISVSLAAHKSSGYGYNSSDDLCDGNFGIGQNNEDDEITFNFTTSGNSSTEWQKFETKPFLNISSDNSDKYDWLILNGSLNRGGGGGHLESAHYMYFDNVKVFQQPICDNECINDKAEVTVTNYYNNPDGTQTVESDTPPTTMFAGTTSTFSTFIKNAISIRFMVFDRDQMIHDFKYLDLNGIKDPGYDDYKLMWDGLCNLLNNDPVVFGNIYSYVLEIRNCISQKTFNKTLRVFLGVSGGVSIDPNNLNVFTGQIKNDLDNCCGDYDYYVQNTTFNDKYFKAVNHDIHAGRNVTNTMAVGDVILQSGADVIFQAGNDVDIQPGFDVLYGAKFDAITKGCSDLGLRKNHIERSDPYINRIDVQDKSISENKNNELINNGNIKLAPNPNDGTFTLSGYNKTPVDISIVNVLGEIIFKQNNVIVQGNYDVKLNDVSKGIYNLKLSSGTSAEVIKMVVY